MLGANQAKKVKEQAQLLVQTEVVAPNNQPHVQQRANTVVPPAPQQTFFQQPTYSQPPIYSQPPVQTTNIFMQRQPEPPRRTNFNTSFRSFVSPGWGEDSSVSGEIRGLRGDLYRERAERRYERAADNRRREQDNLNRNGAPNDNTLRFLASTRAFPLNNANTLFNFIDRNRSGYTTLQQEEFHFPVAGELFMQGLRDCQSEAQARRYMVFVQSSLIRLVKDSHTLSQENKRDFIRLLNTHDHKKDLENAAIIFGVIIFAVVAPTCLMLAAEAKVMECVAFSMLASLLTFGPYWLASKTESQPYFPSDKGAACEVPVFKSWLSGLANLAERINPVPLATVVPPPQDQYSSPNPMQQY